MLLDIIYRQIIEVPDDAFDVTEGYPGAGAIAFHRKHTGTLPRESAEWFIRELYSGNMQFITDNKRVKRCAYCSYYWEDDSTRNNRKLCSDACRKAQRAEQKAEERARKPQEVSEKWQMIDYYLSELEYGYWTDEYEMYKYTWKYNVPYNEAQAERQEINDYTYGEGNRIGRRYRG